MPWNVGPSRLIDFRIDILNSIGFRADFQPSQLNIGLSPVANKYLLFDCTRLLVANFIILFRIGVSHFIANFSLQRTASLT